MSIKTIGQVLKDKRTDLGLGLAEAEQQTNVPKLYIVALETDDYKALPGDFYIRAYLKQYAERLDLDADEILAAYEGGRGISVEEEETPQESYHFVKPSERVVEEEHERTWRDYVPIILLSAAAVAIIAGVGVAVALNKPENVNLSSNSYTYSSSTSQSETSVSKSSQSSSKPSSSEAAEKLTATGSGTALSATLTNAKSPVVLKLSVPSTADTSFSATNSDVTAVTPLNSDTPSATVTLSTGATSSTIVIGYVNGMTLTVNGHNLDLSALTLGQTCTITLNVAKNNATEQSSSSAAANTQSSQTDTTGAADSTTEPATPAQN